MTKREETLYMLGIVLSSELKKKPEDRSSENIMLSKAFSLAKKFDEKWEVECTKSE